jgi:hypothetical protein
MNPPPDKSVDDELVDPYPKKKNGALRWITSVLIIFIFYVLSIGPVYRLTLNQRISASARAAVVFYKPLFKLSESSTAIGRWFRIYLQFWSPYHTGLEPIPETKPPPHP